MNPFAIAKQEFDRQYGTAQEFECFLPEHLTYHKTASLRRANGDLNEQYYKWQFLYAIVASGLYAPDYIGTEIRFPKGNKNAADIKMDAAIFDDINWFDFYQRYHTQDDIQALDWLRRHLVAVIEIKDEKSRDVAAVWDKQLKAYLKESERDFCLGVIYDAERLYLFRKQGGKYLRFSDEFNIQGDDSATKDLSLNIPDPYLNLRGFETLIDWTRGKKIDRSKRSIDNLEVVSGVHSTQINTAMSAILRTMDKQGMVNQRGYEILIQILALKIFDEKRNQRNLGQHLEFYITDDEKKYTTLGDESIQKFLQRITAIRDKARTTYYRILGENVLNIKNANHVRLLIEVVCQFQDYSFVRSTKTDLYQLVFHQFASQFSKDQNAQFVTPLPIIEFLVDIVNPRNGERIIDPTVGIADFLSVAYVNSDGKLDDNNIYGFDIDEDMVKLATLNMLLNGDGNAKIEARAGNGSIDTKFADNGELITLVPSTNRAGKDGEPIDWDRRPDDHKLMKFNVVLTNPPFGEDRAFVPKDDADRQMIECYELWDRYGGGKIDLGVVFLENAYRILDTDGRLGIVLSNSIASIDSHRVVREWLMEKMRVVAIFDLPANVFAETGVNTSIIVAYKPEPAALAKLKKTNYQIFFKAIEKVGYEVKTKKRIKYFDKAYKMDYSTFDIEIDEDGSARIDEEFTETVADFRRWCLTQEKKLQDLFIKEN